MNELIEKFTLKVLKEHNSQNLIANEVRIEKDYLFIGKNTYHLSSLNKINVVGIGKNAYQDILAIKKLFFNKSNINFGQLVAYTKKDKKLVDHDKDITLLEGTHPFVTPNNLEVTQSLCNILTTFNEKDLTIVTLSGGASAILEQLPQCINFDEYDDLQNALINSSISIEDINSVRKSVSLIKNGGLTKYINSHSICLLVSCDIPSGDINSVGSAPLIHNKIKKEKVESILEKIEINPQLKLKINQWMDSLEFENHQLELQVSQTKRNINKVIISDVETLKNTAFQVIQKQFNDAVNGDFPVYNEPVGRVVEAEIKRIQTSKGKLFLSGGEATVKVTSSNGKGGRNTHYCAMMAQKIFKENVLNLNAEKLQKVWILSLATDGSDGPTEQAGAYFCGEKYNSQIDFQKSIDNFYTWTLFNSLDCLLDIPPTGINLMDLRVIFIPN